MSRRALLVSCMLLACDPGVRVGTPCEYTSQCTAPLVCGLGRCRPECHANADCSLGAACVLAGDPPVGSCQLPDDPTCPDTACAAGFACVSGACLNECTSDDACAQGNVCVATELGIRACVAREDAPDAAVEPDAGSDGGTPCTGIACDPIVSIASAWQHSCVARASGRVWCWGIDVSGESSGSTGAAQACTGGIACRTRPIEIALVGGEHAEQVSVGASYSCARTREGHAQCWGASYSGQLGRPEPGPVPGLVRDESTGAALEGVIEISAGRSHVLARRAGDLVGWGSGLAGELMGGENLARARVIDPAPWDLVGAGEQFSCGVRGGALSCWGQNDNGQLARPPGSPASSTTPLAIDTRGEVTMLAVGSEQMCAAGAWDAPDCWGWDLDDRMTGARWSPVVNPAAPIRSITGATEGRATCGTFGTTTLQARCWGRADFYPAGYVLSDTTPIHPDELGDVALLSVDSGGGCALERGTGTLRCWGVDDVAQLGGGSFGDPSGPVVVAFD